MELARLLRRLGYRQKDFASEIGVHPVSVSRWARGQNETPVLVLRYLRLRVKMIDLAEERNDES